MARVKREKAVIVRFSEAERKELDYVVGYEQLAITTLIRRLVRQEYCRRWVENANIVFTPVCSEEETGNEGDGNDW